MGYEEVFSKAQFKTFAARVWILLILLFPSLVTDPILLLVSRQAGECQ
jgi:hypothetical protein